MPPTTQEPQLDQDAVRLAKAIRHVESRDNENAQGASGEFGLYQWMPDTWASTTKKYNLDPNDKSRANQNKAAYTQIKELKDKGFKPDQIAAFWNSGKTDGWEAMRGVNKHGVKYDVPAYVNSIKGAYEQLKTSDVAPTQVSPSTAGHAQFGTPDEPKRSLIENIGQFAIGAAKGVGNTVQDLGALGEGVLNQTAGRVVSAVGGKGFVPMDEKNFTYSDKSTSGQKMEEALKAEGAAQKLGKVTEKVAEFFVPIGAAKNVAKPLLEAKRLEQASQKAFEIVAPKGTKHEVIKALKGGRTETTGFMRSIDMLPEQRTERAAEAVSDMIRRGTIKAEWNVSQKSNAILDEIGSTADDLIGRLKAMDVKPILQPEELDGLMQNALKEIGENPTMTGEATETAVKIFTKFRDFLPKGQDITAEDVLIARKKLDQWMKMQRGTNVFDPAKENAMSIALRAIRQNANDVIAQLAPDVPVRELLYKQSDLYHALDNVVEKGWRDVGTNITKRSPLLQTGSGLMRENLKNLLPFGIGAFLR